MPGDSSHADHLDAKVTLRRSLVHPDLSPFIDDTNGLKLYDREHEQILLVPGDIDPRHGAALEEAVWDRMHFASHLRTERLGEFTVGTELHRSESLAIVQVLILYHIATARAAVALGGEGRVTDKGPVLAPAPAEAEPRAQVS